MGSEAADGSALLPHGGDIAAATSPRVGHSYPRGANESCALCCPERDAHVLCALPLLEMLHVLSGVKQKVDENRLKIVVRSTFSNNTGNVVQKDKFTRTLHLVPSFRQPWKSRCVRPGTRLETPVLL